ncbi:MAG TPA: zf-HC2 domain-containing protein, partial [Pyrinomonadaceae bacterium]|nr:zf-HC2 domain-containing protein [Pyrinomonadaceae bacterium]
MNKTENNEIDLLLRSLAQRKRLHPTASESHSEKHLDADELSSYAEQALPAATRARYTSHLADCSSCRKIVSELTAASGNRFREPLVSPDPSGGFLERLGALLSPRLLRYVVPALAVVIFVVVGWVALFQSRQTDFVAQNQQANQPVNTPATPSGVAESTKSTGEL